jgi:nicotinamide phosphoribosyltransferase
MLHQHNIILNSDSYKYSQYAQYPEGTEYVYSYIESRGGEYDKTVFFGLQAFIQEYLCRPITRRDIDAAEDIILAHGEPFNRKGWEYIVKKHKGYLPVKIMAAPEGLVIPTSNVLATIVNTDPKCFWLTSFLETALLRAIWYPTTVATNSYESKKIILEYLEKTGDPSSIGFKLHDFGARGVSSLESAAIGGAAHLVNFMGTDTISALLFANQYYGSEMAGFSIPAMEHSTVTSWGRDREVDSYRNMVKTFGKEGAIMACVSDSYDIYNACKLWGTELKQDVIDSGATIVIRPDSGDPATVVLKCIQILDEYFGSVQNEMGYFVLNNVRVIQGDGINHDSIREILEVITRDGYSADNVAFGQGGALLQHVNRDTMKFAMKCSAAFVNGEWVDVFKDPITDSGKRSKKGRVSLWKNIKTEQYISCQDVEGVSPTLQVLEPVFEDGHLLRHMTLEEIRQNAKI